MCANRFCAVDSRIRTVATEAATMAAPAAAKAAAKAATATATILTVYLNRRSHNYADYSIRILHYILGRLGSTVL